MPFLTKYSPFLLVVAVVAVASFSVQAGDRNVEHGKYLVTVMSCTDCHTPGALLGKPDTKRYLGGSEVGFVLPDLGVFYGANLTPDKATGLGNWTIDEIAGAIRLENNRSRQCSAERFFEQIEGRDRKRPHVVEAIGFAGLDGYPAASRVDDAGLAD